jgi:hypothetical protein
MTLWLASAVATAGTLWLVAIAQGLVVLWSGGQFIGVSLPPHLQPWALVNQPALNFASTPAGLAHFAVGAVVCLLIAVMAPAIIPRPSTMAAELGMIQMAWTAAVYGLGWIPLVDPWDGHLARMLRLRDAPQALLWTLPFVAAVAALPAVIRLLSLARSATPQLLGPQRLGVVVAGLVLPTITTTAGLVALLTVTGWPDTPLDGVGFLGEDPRRAALGVIPALLLAMVVAATRVPTTNPLRLRAADGRSVMLMALLATLLAASVAVAGAPLANATARSLLWGSPNHLNNIRPWIDRTARPTVVP